MRQGPLAGRYPAVAAMVTLALIPYLALSAAHARGVAFLYLEASCVLTVVIVAAMLASRRRQAT